MNYYNEIDPYAARWLENLVAARHIPDGTVDARSILAVDPADLDGYTQCHFFAGIAGWPYALDLAGWDPDRPVWTASCPCQPLSSAGQRKGHADQRHLWPALHRLVAERRPATILGEQVASKLGREWLAGVRADLEHLGYAVGAADLPAAGVGAPHIRQRLFWVADAPTERRQHEPTLAGSNGAMASEGESGFGISGGGASGGLANADRRHAAQERSGNRALGGQRTALGRRTVEPAGPGAASRTRDGHLAEGNGGLADAVGGRARTRRGDDGEMRRLPGEERSQDGADLSRRSGATGGVAQSNASGWREGIEYDQQSRGELHAEGRGAAGGLGDPGSGRRRGRNGRTEHEGRGSEPGDGIQAGGLADADQAGSILERRPGSSANRNASQRHHADRRRQADPWTDAAWIPCRDGKARRTQPGTFPLAHGIPNRLGQLRAYGNAVVPQTAAAFIQAVMETTQCLK